MKKEQEKTSSPDQKTALNNSNIVKKNEAPENENFISEKDEVKFAEDRLREQVKKKST